MGFGNRIGSKIDRNGSTFADRHEAIKAASKLASRAMRDSTLSTKSKDLSASRLAKPKDGKHK